MLKTLRSNSKAVATLAVALLVLAFLCVQSAFADEPEVVLNDQVTEELSNLQAQIESTAADYDQAVARIDELQGKIDTNQARIDEINAALPGQKASAAGALKLLYVLQAEGYNIVNLALSTDNLTDFLKQVDYIDCIHQYSTGEITKLDSMKDELETTQNQLEKDKEEAETAVDRAARAMEQAKAARQQAQEEAIAQAKAEAEANAAANAAAEEAALAAAAEAMAAVQAEGGDQAAATQAAQEAAQEAYVEAGGTTSAAASSALSAIDWDVSKEDFVSEWTDRINDYLEGSAMAGQGENYAEAAWRYGVDPRISPAISTVESATGSACFQDHNAWGWGNSSWSSWEEAIDAHVSGYAHGYSNNVTMEDASKYCPPNAGEWQSRVIDNMESM